jgi:hypothetical protein
LILLLLLFFLLLFLLLPPPLRAAQGRIEEGCSLILLWSLLWFEAKAFRAKRESLFFERQRKVTKRKPP